MMKNNRFLRSVATFLCALMLCAPAFSLAEAAEQDVVEMISTQTKLDLEPYRGKAIFLNFFTEWCPYCMQEMPDIRELYDTYDPEELEIVLVHVWDGEDGTASARISEKYGLEGMHFFEDEDRGLAQYVGLSGYPSSIFINKDGTLHTGFSSGGDFATFAGYADAMGAAKKPDAE